MAYDNSHFESDPVVRRTIMVVGIGAVIAVAVMFLLEKIF